ncbi:cysteine proteinase [Linderina pennispora]|uniref:Cysteine proteinase n=1 Tax=Linderina pennispora TaxID=61395 RepID=A0A1Y1WIA5_9FUNG|nr:cysteine proteinase [Linderina pennispora]ORX73269.1 cysteine proteinase [Linderina pennispora]
MAAPLTSQPPDAELPLDKYAPPPHGYSEQSHGVFHWDITSYHTMLRQSQLYAELYSKEFALAGFDWSMTLNLSSSYRGEFIGLHVHCKTADTMPEDWEQCIIYSIRFENPADPSSSEGVQQRYRLSREYASLDIPHAFLRRTLKEKKIYNNVPVIQNNKLRISVYMRAISDPTRMLWHDFSKTYNSLVRTGYVGLENHLPYKSMTALLLTLYQIKPLREAIASIRGKDPIRDESFHIWGMMRPKNGNGLSREIAEVYHRLGSTRPTTHIYEMSKAITRLGYIAGYYIPLGHVAAVVLERVVREIGMVVDNRHLLPMMCGLKQTTTIRIADRTSMLEIFDAVVDEDEEEPELAMVNPLILDISGCYDVKSVLRKHFSLHVVKTNQQPIFTVIQIHNSVRRVEVLELPTVLFINFERFTKPFRPITIYKTDALVTFEETLDMAEESGSPTKYTLFAVMVHVGEGMRGTHASFMRPKMDQWFVFEDDLVFPVHHDVVFDRVDVNQYLSTIVDTDRPRKILSAKRFRNTYMLVYIRDDQIDYVLGL